MVVPLLGGRIRGSTTKGCRRDLLRRDSLPVAGLDEGLPQTPYVSLGGYEEYAGREFGSVGWGHEYESVVAADRQSVTLTAVLAQRPELVRVVSLAPDKPELTVDSRLEILGVQTVKDAVLHVHPEFLPQAGGEVPELLGLGDDGAWKTIPYQAGDNYLSGASRPQGGWSLRFPKAGLRLENSFDPAQVETCYFFNGKTFFNLELLSPGRDLAPVISLRLRHCYVVECVRP